MISRKIKERIKAEQTNIVKANKALLAQGKHYEYHMNCNYLAGMNFVLEKLEKEKKTLRG